MHTIENFYQLTPEDRRWVETTFARLSLDAKIGQVLHPKLFDDSTPFEKTQKDMAICQFGGGFIAGSYRQLRQAVADFTAESVVPPLFSSDLECGARLVQEATKLGASMALAAISDLNEAGHYAYEAGKVTALQGTAAGIRWSFAPLADLNFNPDNPITNVRSYGDDPERVALLLSAYIRGMQDHGMAAALKHFPGDGVDSRDQHTGTSLNTLSFEEWTHTYGRTFSAGIAAGTYAIMMGHIALANISSRDAHGRYLPATLDSAIQIDLLRNRLGFQGVIISDAMEMGGVRSRCHTEAEALVKNLAAGSDIVLMPQKARNAVAAFRKAIADGKLAEERLNDAVWRVLCLKAKLRLYDPKVVHPPEDEASRALAPDLHAPLARGIAEKSITLVRDQEKDYPLRIAPGAKIVLCYLPRDLYTGGLVVATEIDDDTSPQTPLENDLLKRGYLVTRATTVGALKEALVGAAALIYISNTVCQAGRGSIRLTKGAHSLINWEVVMSELPVFFVSFGTPYSAWELPDLPNFACGYLATPAVEETYARLLLGEIPFQGRLPVKLPPL